MGRWQEFYFLFQPSYAVSQMAHDAMGSLTFAPKGGTSTLETRKVDVCESKNHSNINGMPGTSLSN